MRGCFYQLRLCCLRLTGGFLQNALFMTAARLHQGGLPVSRIDIQTQQGIQGARPIDSGVAT